MICERRFRVREGVHITIRIWNHRSLLRTSIYGTYIWSLVDNWCFVEEEHTVPKKKERIILGYTKCQGCSAQFHH